jgi:hypothetical protein
LLGRYSRLERAGFNGFSHAIFQLRFASGARTMNAAEDLSVSFDPVPDDPATAMRTYGCQRVDRALEAVKRVALAANDDFKRLVVFVLANFACSHTQLLRAGGGARRCPICCSNRFFWP